jgi:hypothetical protein
MFVLSRPNCPVSIAMKKESAKPSLTTYIIKEQFLCTPEFRACEVRPLEDIPDKLTYESKGF